MNENTDDATDVDEEALAFFVEKSYKKKKKPGRRSNWNREDVGT